jgi:PAS domain S-box-containing protein
MRNTSPDLSQIDFLFSKISEGFAYCKIITDDQGKPIDWVYLDVNDAYERINGVKRNAIVGKKVSEVIPNIEADSADWINLYGKVALIGAPVVAERFSEAREKWYHISAFSPKKGYFVSIFEDITERKKIEKALKESEERFSKAFHASSVAMTIASLPDETWTDVNDAFLTLTGYSREEIVGHNSAELNMFEGNTAKRDQIIKMLQERGSIGNIELDAKIKNEKIVNLLFSGVVLNLHGERYVLSMQIDITERKQAEDDARKAKADWERTFDAVPEFIALLDTNYRIIRANKPMAQQLGVTPEKAVGLICYECVHGTEAPPDNCPHAQLLKDNQQHTAEVHEPHLGGYFLVSDTPLKDQRGQLIGSVHVARNITEQKQAEEALKKSEEKYRSLFINMIDGFAHCQMIYDSTGKPVDFIYLDVNDAFERLTGLRKEKILGKKVSEAIPGTLEANAELIEIYGRVASTGKDERFEIYFKPLSTWFSVSVYSERKGYFIAVFEDVTERKQAEEALRESEQRWSTTLSSIGDAVIAADTEGMITFMNPVAEALTGWTLDEVKQKPVKLVLNIINEQTRKEVESPVSQVLQKGLTVGLANHTILIRKDGTEVPIDDSGAPIVTEDGVIRGVVLVFRDITQRKKAEESIQRQASLIDLSPDAIIVRKPEGTITFWSKGAERLYGWTKKEALGKSTHELFETKFPIPFELIVSELETKLRWTGELMQTTKDGRVVVIQSWWLAEKTEHGKIKSILESNIDLTERKEAEKEIARLASFPTLNPNPVVEVTLDGKVTYVNPATKNLFPTLETAGLNHIFFSEWETLKKAFEDKIPTAFGREMKIEGHWYHQQFYLVPQTQQIRIYTVDIDELKQTEEARALAQKKLEENAVMLEEYASQMEELAEQRAQQLQNSERMAAIGQTAGMVGHDIRNPLQAITSDMYLISEEAKAMTDNESKESIMESIDSVNQNLGYINKIVSDLQDYTRPLKPNLQEANLAELIEGTLVTINVPNGIEVTTDIKNTAIPIQTDIAYMRRILTNLITNAIQAMQEEGKLTIQAARKKGVFTVTIEDTGEGIPEEIKAKLFTPLFTTKSKGQGLGLAVVKRLVEALKGTITFDSAEGKGTKFTVEFPQEK